MSQHDLTQTIAQVTAELAAAPLTAAEAARLAPRLADLLTALRALDELDLAGVEPATMLEVGTDGVRDGLLTP
jgi:Asp-tRNA(Asn)/Glu-tRNA(Gln) amidotransferase C subunit